MRNAQRARASEAALEQSIGFALYDVARLWTNEIDKRMRDHGLTHSQWRVLIELSHDDGMTQKALSDQLGVGQVSLGGVLARLESAGWISREIDEIDTRAKRVYVARNIGPLNRELARIAKTVRAELLKGISAADIAKFQRDLRLIKSNAKRVLSQAD